MSAQHISIHKISDIYPLVQDEILWLILWWKENEVVEFVPTEKDFATYALAPSTKLHGFFENRDSR